MQSPRGAERKRWRLIPPKGRGMANKAKARGKAKNEAWGRWALQGGHREKLWAEEQGGDETKAPTSQSKSLGPRLVPVTNNLLSQESHPDVKPRLAMNGCGRHSPEPATECGGGCVLSSVSPCLDLRGWKLTLRAMGSACLGQDPVPTHQLG